MGFSVSWIAFKGLGKGEVLATLGFRDLGEHDEANEAPFSLAQLPSDWCILFSNDFEFADEDRARALSNKCEILSCQIHEGVMYSAAHQALDGVNVWSVWHDGQVDLYNVGVSGRAPKVLSEISTSAHAEQDANGGKDSEVDYSFDIPVEIAFRLTGYRHDRWRFEWGEPHFTVVESAL